MIKQFSLYIISFCILFFLLHYTQDFILSEKGIEINYNLWDTNLFFAFASLIICIHFYIFSKIKLLKPQLGYIYLPTMFIKGVLFYLSFKNSVFAIDNLSVAERLNLLIPLLLFLVLEVLFIIKILNNKAA
jgi:hypothetical protein